MLTATTTSHAATAPAAPVAAPRLAVGRRCRPGLVALAVALVATGGLSAAYAISLVGSTNAYLAVNRHIEAGARVEASDLLTVRISLDPALRPIPAAQADEVVGRYAAVPLFPGGLLTRDLLSEVPLGGAGTYLVSIGLPRGRIPAQRIRPGAQVILVATPSEMDLRAAAASSEPPQTFEGVVADVSEPNQHGTVFVNVAVAQSDGAAVATLAAAERIVIVMAGG